MYEHDALQNISEEEVTAVLKALKPLFPLSIRAYYFIDSVIKWKKKVPDYDIGILCPEGGHKSGAVFFYYTGFNNLVFSAYVWTKEGEEALQNAILKTERFHWNDYKFVEVTCVTEQMWSVFEPVIQKVLKKCPKPHKRDKVFWLPAEEVIKFDVKVPEGMRLDELKKEHVEIINSLWPFRDEYSDKLIELMTWVNFGRGLFKPDGELIAWAFYWFYGGLGVLHTVESERRKGYGKVVVQAVSKEMGSRGLDVHLVVVEGNTVAEAFFTSLGFKYAFDSFWIVCQNF